MGGVNDSQFNMWRAIFALAHADDVVTPEELRFMAEILEDLPFSAVQQAILSQDVKEPQSVEEMFDKITDQVDQVEFFKFASKIVHVDGDFGHEEREVMLRVTRMHLQKVDVDALIGNVALDFDDEYDLQPVPDFKKAVFSYREKFLEKLIPKD